jgi:hypothetical protein
MVGSKALVRKFRPLWHHHFGEWHHFQTIASEVRGAHNIFLYAINRLERDYQKLIQKPSLQPGAKKGELQTLESWVHWIYPGSKLNYLEFLHDFVKEAAKFSLPNKSRKYRDLEWTIVCFDECHPHRPKRRDSRTHRKRNGSWGHDLHPRNPDGRNLWLIPRRDFCVSGKIEWGLGWGPQGSGYIWETANLRQKPA